MTVTVLLFASYAEAVGVSSLRVELATAATLGDIVDHVRSLPGAGHLPAQPLLAVNQRYATRSQRLSPNDEVAIIPPVAGG